jgi:hypothetical protein
MLTISGIYKKCAGAASGNLKVQLPLLEQEFPEIKGCFSGTLNLQLHHPLLVLTPDHRSKAIDWQPEKHPGGEVFDLLRIELEAPEGAEPIRAWLYIAHNSDHRRNPTSHELIAPPLLQPLPPDSCCTIRIDRNYIQLPYREWSALLVL